MHGFTVIRESGNRHDAGAWALEMISGKGNWKLHETIVASSVEQRRQYLCEANELRHVNSVNPNAPLKIDRYSFPIVHWDCVYRGNRLSRKLVGGYPELLQFLKYLNEIKKKYNINPS